MVRERELLEYRSPPGGEICSRDSFHPPGMFSGNLQSSRHEGCGECSMSRSPPNQLPNEELGEEATPLYKWVHPSLLREVWAMRECNREVHGQLPGAGVLERGLLQDAKKNDKMAFLTENHTCKGPVVEGTC